jgi:hypothetical protein
VPHDSGLQKRDHRFQSGRRQHNDFKSDQEIVAREPGGWAADHLLTQLGSRR